MTAQSHYPIVPDWERRALDVAPPCLRVEPTRSIYIELCRGIIEADTSQAEMVRDLDPAVAQGRTLEMCGERVGESRDGLDDDEYRRIILGREAAAVARGTVSGVWATWLALSGATEDRARMWTVPTPGLPCVGLEAEVTRTPTTLFRLRAARVLLDAVIYPYEVTAALYLAGAAFGGRQPGGGVGTGGIPIV